VSGLRTIGERLLNVAEGECACGGTFKWTGVQMRCDRCDHHLGYPVRAEVLALIREAAAALDGTP
jgi:hypothetical protein